MIGKALLPAPSSAKSLPAPEQEKSETSTSASPVLKEEASAEPLQAVKSVPKSEVSDGALSGLSRPLSPYPYVRSSPGDIYSNLLLFKFLFPLI